MQRLQKYSYPLILFMIRKNSVFIKFTSILIIVLVLSSILFWQENIKIKTSNKTLENHILIMSNVFKNLNEQRIEMNNLTTLGIELKNCNNISCKEDLAEKWNASLQNREELEKELQPLLLKQSENARKVSKILSP